MKRLAYMVCVTLLYLFFVTVCSAHDGMVELDRFDTSELKPENADVSLFPSVAGGEEAPAGVAAEWWTQVQQRITRQEYHITWQERTALPEEGGAWQAPNRAHNLRIYFTSQGVRMVPRTETNPSWTLGLELAGMWYTECGKVIENGTAIPRAPDVLKTATEGNRIEFHRGDIVEYYENDEGGVKQGFAIKAPLDSDMQNETPSGKDHPILVLDMEIKGDLTARMKGDGETIEFVNREGVGVMQYSKVTSRDGDGNNLFAGVQIVSSSSGQASRIRLEIDTTDAVYPVKIDWLITAYERFWTAESDQAGALFGWSAAGAGDVNGDGYTDIIIGAPYYDNGKVDEGRVYVYFGSPSGLNTTVSWTTSGDQGGAHFGWSVAGAGDVNGDGYDDVIVGAPDFDHSEVQEGAAYVFHGSATGLSAKADWTAEIDRAGALFGWSVAGAGDVNGDGYADVIVGAPHYSNEEMEEGGAFVYHGAASGLLSTPAWSGESNQAYAHYGCSVAGAGDVNGDGCSDVIVGAKGYDDRGEIDQGRVYVYHGSTEGLSVMPAWTAQRNHAYIGFGCSVAGAGDVNGDGYDDVIVGAEYYDNNQTNEGAAYAYYGSATGLSEYSLWYVESNQEEARFGSSVAAAGDVNGDGYDDVIVGAPYYTHGELNEGRSYVFYGSTTGLITTEDWSMESDQVGAAFGSSVAAAGDVNGDGYDDVIVGAPYYAKGEMDEGAAYVYYGSATGLLSRVGWSAESDQAYAYYGFSVAGAGDVNGDGYSDVIVGAPNYDHGESDEGMVFVYHGTPAGLSLTAAWNAEGDQAFAMLGMSVAGAGDVNGDGYSDVLVGAPYWDHDKVNVGKAYVFHGSVDGLSDTAAWTAGGKQKDSFFGWSVAMAGDVNGDGYTDVIVGVPYYANDEYQEGGAYVYHGSATGLSADPVWTAESDQERAWFGLSVAGAGDVNGDGYADIVVGAPHVGNKVYVYHGSSSGLSLTAAWNAESDQEFASFGYSVAGAGDVNGDGYADLIVGAPYYDHGEMNEGRAYVYHGSPTGLSPLADWIVESNQTNACFGNAVAGAGDVNGDGYADVVVGACGYYGSTKGWIHVYYGSRTGLSSTAVFVAEGNQRGGEFGWSVACAGDVNGDGYSDVIVGAPRYDHSEPNEGRAYVFYGSPSTVSETADWTVVGQREGDFLGRVVASAGDVNGDGYADVIVSAPRYINSEGVEGRVYVYHGSATGLSSEANWIAEGEQAGSSFGYSIAGAGDVNGDGYSDVIVGAPDYDHIESSEGRVYVYHGSPTGLSTTPSWTIEGAQSGAGFGRVVAGAGDVNGDGYSDIIIGAPRYKHAWEAEGSAYVYHGSCSGLSVMAEWTIEGENTRDQIGGLISAAGDVNGDGYGDVVVCVDQDDMMFVYYGSESGLSATPDWSRECSHEYESFRTVVTAGDVNGDGYSDVLVGKTGGKGGAYVFHGSSSGLSSVPDRMIESDQTSSYFGAYVASAGDVNGDGYADIIVGAPFYAHDEINEGRAYIYYGSASGLHNTPAWSGEGNQSGAWFGGVVAGTGDVNGDGYADVVVGAEYYDTVEYNEGKAFVYYGNGGGLSLMPQQRRVDATAPISLLGWSDCKDSFRLALLGRTPYGRSKVKLECEVKPLGIDFNGSDTVVTANWVDSGTTGVLLNELISGLSEKTLYHWRVRLLYHPISTPLQRYSRWLTIPLNGWNEADVRTASSTLADYSFDTDDEGWRFVGAVPGFDTPLSACQNSVLGICALDSSNAFSYWYSPDIRIKDGQMYRARWKVGSTSSTHDDTINFRLRVNQKGSWQAWHRIVNSFLGQAPCIEERKTYDPLIS